MYRSMAMESAAPPVAMADNMARAKSLGVTIEDEFTVGEYDIQLLSAEQSDGLMTPSISKTNFLTFIKACIRPPLSAKADMACLWNMRGIWDGAILARQTH